MNIFEALAGIGDALRAALAPIEAAADDSFCCPIGFGAPHDVATCGGCHDTYTGPHCFDCHEGHPGPCPKQLEAWCQTCGDVVDIDKFQRCLSCSTRVDPPVHLKCLARPVADFKAKEVVAIR